MPHKHIEESLDTILRSTIQITTIAQEADLFNLVINLKMVAMVGLEPEINTFN